VPWPEAAGSGAHQLAVAGEEPRIDRIGLAEDAETLGEAAHACRVDDGHPHAGRGEAVRRQFVVGRGGLEDDMHLRPGDARDPRRPGRDLVEAGGVIGEGTAAEGLGAPYRQERTVQPVFRDVDPEEYHAVLRPVGAPLCADPPCRCRLVPTGRPSLPSDLVKGAVVRSGAPSAPQTRGLTSPSGWPDLMPRERPETANRYNVSCRQIRKAWARARRY
jgi:hypothetical protein